MDLATRVKMRREQLGFTQDELAKRMGYKSRVSINKIENGRPVSQKIIVRLAAALHTTPSYLMGWTNDVEGSDIEEKPTTQSDGLTDREQEALSLFRRLSPELQKNFLDILSKIPADAERE